MSTLLRNVMFLACVGQNDMRIFRLSEMYKDIEKLYWNEVQKKEK